MAGHSDQQPRKITPREAGLSCTDAAPEKRSRLGGSHIGHSDQLSCKRPRSEADPDQFSEVECSEQLAVKFCLAGRIVHLQTDSPEASFSFAKHW